jgi:hypothetical protein
MFSNRPREWLSSFQPAQYLFRRHSVVPPPLCAATVAFEAAVQAVGILSGESDGGPEALVAVLADGGLAMARCVESDLWEETAEAEDDDSDGDLLLRCPLFGFYHRRESAEHDSIRSIAAFFLVDVRV